MDGLVDYLNEIVEPTINDLHENPTSVRHAFLACVATFHAIDYLAYPRKSGNLKKKWREQSPEFAIVDNVAHAFKHVVAGNRGNPDLAATQVISRPPGRAGMMVSGLSFVGDGDGGVTFVNNVDVELFYVLMNR